MKSLNTRSAKYVLCSGGSYAVSLVPVCSVAGKLLSFSFDIAGGWQALLAARISEKNKGKGVIIDLTWALTFKVKKQ